MDKKKILVITILFFSLIAVISIAGLTGLPVPKLVKSHNCSVTYLHHMAPNFLCQYLTAGHCESTEFNKRNAEMQIARCLCDEFENEKDQNISNDIVALCKNDKGCLYSIETLKSEEINYESDNSDDISRLVDNYANDSSFLCDNKEIVFSYSVVE